VHFALPVPGRTTPFEDPVAARRSPAGAAGGPVADRPAASAGALQRGSQRQGSPGTGGRPAPAQPPTGWRRRLPIGAEVAPGGGVHFRVWAPACRRVTVTFGGGAGGRAGGAGDLELDREPGCGYFSGFAGAAAAGELYRYRLDGGDAFPDPASRFQPDGPHGPSRVVDPSAYGWRDAGWRGPSPLGQVIYELHAGTFTSEGTWAAAAGRLPELAELGVTMLEVMPVAEFAGRFGWGYDGVDLFAPTRLYGEPDDLRGFVDRAHELGLAVILDVVYNHFGPDGNYLERFSPGYFTGLHTNDWGKAIHFYGAPEVREMFVANAAYWIEEYHLDGLRLDATQDIHDRSREHVLTAIGRAARQAAAALAPGRAVYLVAENEPQDSRLVRSLEQGGHGLDAIWNDDFHHAARVALTGRAEAYYRDYRGSPQELVAAAKFGTLYQGQRYHWQGKRRGTPAIDLPRHAFVAYLQNHDQVANSARGERLHRLVSPGCFRAMTALLLLGPATPLLFQGQELCASAPFVFFADHRPELASAVRRGRQEFLAQFPSLANPAVQAAIPDPGSPATFRLCKLDPAERRSPAHAAALALHRDLLRLRREDPVFRLQAAGGIDGAVLGPAALVLRWFAPAAGGASLAGGGDASRAGGDDATQNRGRNATPAGGRDALSSGDRLLVVNLGPDLDLTPAPEPLLAPPAGARWQVLWSSEDPRYGGSGAPPPEDAGGAWRLPGQAAIALAPAPREAESPGPPPEDSEP
jgi:maltooligosyltrehalose trehalohydrolase